MSWAKLCDHIDIDPDILKLHPDAFAYFVGTITYSSRHLTDGLIEADAAPDILRFRGGRKINVGRALAALEKHGFLDPVEGGWQVRNYLKFNPSRAQVEARRAATLIRVNKCYGKKGRKKRITADVSNVQPDVNAANADASNNSPVPDPELSKKEDPNPGCVGAAPAASEAGSPDAEAAAQAASPQTPCEARQESQATEGKGVVTPAPPEPAGANLDVPDGKQDGAQTLDLTAEHLDSPVDLIMDRAAVIAAGASDGLGLFLNGTQTSRLAAICPVRRQEYREALKITRSQAETPCWRFLISTLVQRRAKNPPRPEPELDLGRVESKATEVKL